MPVRRVTLRATVADTFKRVIDLISPASSAIEGALIDGVLTFETNGLLLATLPKGTSPGTETAFQTWPANSFIATGPEGKGYQIEELWVKNSTAGSNAVVAYTGAIETVD